MKTFATAGLVVFVGLTQGGCNQQAAQQAEAQNALAQAVTAIQVAERGYIPADAGAQTDQVLTYRNQKLGQALPDLDAAIAAGSPEQQAAAGRLKAMVLLSEARFDMRQAVAAYAELAPQGVALLRYLVTVDRADAGVASLDVDEADMLKTLAGETQDQKARQQELTRQAQSLHSQITSLEAQVQQHQETARKHRAAGAAYDQQAFTAQGDARFDLADQAANEIALADKASTEADKLTAKMDQLQVVLKLVESEQKLVALVLDRLDQRAEEAHTSETGLRTAHTQAQQEQAQATQTLTQQFDEVTQAYASTVDQPLLAAGQRAGKAVTTLEQAVRTASGANRSAVEEDLLAAIVTRVHVLTEHVATAQNFGTTLSIVVSSGSRLLPQIAAQTQQTYDDLAKKQSRLIDEAREGITQGNALADRLGSDDALAQKAFLDAYTQRLDATALK